MIKNIENKKISITYEDKAVTLPEEIKEKIKKSWQKFQNENPVLYNGDVTCVSSYETTDNEINIKCQKSDFAHYLYDERIGLPIEYSCINISAGCLLETIDGYYLIGELDEKMSYPHVLQISGGNVDKKDIKNGIVDIMKTISREVMEEVNIDLYDESQVYNLKLKYIYETEKNDKPKVQIFAKANLKMTSEEVQDYYDSYFEYLKANNLEIEFGKIHLIKKSNAIEILKNMSNPKREYLLPLINSDLANC